MDGVELLGRYGFAHCWISIWLEYGQVLKVRGIFHIAMVKARSSKHVFTALSLLEIKLYWDPRNPGFTT